MIDLVDRKYRVYYNNSSCKVYNGDHIYALNMCSTMIPIEIEKTDIKRIATVRTTAEILFVKRYFKETPFLIKIIQLFTNYSIRI